MTDHNTSDPVNGAKVASQANPGQSGVSQATPDDPNLSDGFYWLFATPAGATPFKASDGNYTPSTQTVNVANNAVVHQNWSLQAGHLTITPGACRSPRRWARPRPRPSSSATTAPNRSR